MEEVKSDIITVPWTKDDAKTLIDRIENHFDNPPNEPYHTTWKKIDWDSIKFEPHDAADCKQFGQRLILKARRFRKLNEVIGEIRTNFDNFGRMWRSSSPKPTKPTKPTKPKERNPKKPKSALSRFIEHKIGSKNYDNKDDLKEAREKYKERFNNMSTDKKQKYIDQYEAELEDYKKKFDEYVKNTPQSELKSPQGIKRKRQLEASIPRAPAPPHSPLQLYIANKMINIETKDENTRKQLRQEYTNLSDKKKFRWIKKAKEDQERYEKEISEYKAAYPQVALKQVKPAISQKENLKYEHRLHGRPLPPARSSYLEFCGGMMTEMKNTDDNDPKNKLKDAVSRWRELKPEEKTEYEKRFAMTVHTYIESMKQYLADASPEDRLRIQTQEAKTTPEYWTKILKRLKIKVE